jgi:hypothetical protein
VRTAALPIPFAGSELADDALIGVDDPGAIAGAVVLDIVRRHPMIVPGQTLQHALSVPPHEFLAERHERRTAREVSAV